MATTTASFHPSAPLRAVQLFGILRDAVNAESDVWKLYRMSRGTDSVAPAVVEKLAQVAAAK